MVGRLDYDPGRRSVVLLATHADDEEEGVGSALARRALDDSRSSGSRQVVAVCAYAA